MTKSAPLISATQEEGEVDPELVALAETIIERKAGAFEPANFHDRYQDALRELVQSKLKGEVMAAPEEDEEPPKVINLMDALKRSLAREEAGAGRAASRRIATFAGGSPARRQTWRSPAAGAAVAGLGRPRQAARGRN